MLPSVLAYGNNPTGIPILNSVDDPSLAVSIIVLLIEASEYQKKNKRSGVSFANSFYFSNYSSLLSSLFSSPYSLGALVFLHCPQERYLPIING